MFQNSGAVKTAPGLLRQGPDLTLERRRR